MSKDTLHYLTAHDRDKIEYWTSDLGPLIEKNPRLRQVDLVVEGGVGTNRTMVHMMRRAFPQALYIGMDTSEMLGAGSPWLNGSIDQEDLQRLLRVNEYPTLQMDGAMLKASCYDFALIRDIAQKTGRNVALLATFKALFSLMHRREMNPFEKKHFDKEVVTIDGLVSFNNPFIAQIHIPAHEPLETAARQAGWTTDRFDIGLLLLRPIPTNAS